jgi:HlyD family secretion protein
LKVAEGEQIVEGQTVALLDGFEQAFAVVNEAKTRVEMAKRKLDQIRAGAKTGDLAAQNAQTKGSKPNSKTPAASVPAPKHSSRETPVPEYAAIERLERELANAQTELSRSQSSTNPATFRVRN